MRFLQFISISILVAVVLAILACGGESEPQDREFSLKIREGKLDIDPTTIKVDQGDTVTLLLDSDEEGSVHLHGYDLDVEVMPGMEANLNFVASATGSFKFELHHGETEDHSHDEDEACQAEVPTGAPTPSVAITASPGTAPGEVHVAVDLESFVLEPAPEGTTLATGHWHLMIDGELTGMYQVPEISTKIHTAGEHQLMATLSDPQHCMYGISGMTKIALEEGSGEEAEMEEMEEMEEEEDEGTFLGTVEIYPR